MKVWARVGMTIEVPEDEVLDFAQNMENRIEQYYERGLAKFDGEVYLPEDVDCEENDAMLKIMSDEWEKKKTFVKENWKKPDEDFAEQLAFGPGERRALMEKGSAMYPGKSIEGEDILVQVDETGIEVKTFQENGWMRVDYYNERGYHEGQTFQGRWK